MRPYLCTRSCKWLAGPTGRLIPPLEVVIGWASLCWNSSCAVNNSIHSYTAGSFEGLSYRPVEMPQNLKVWDVSG